MAIISQKVTIKVHSQTFKYYESCGYIIPRYKDSNGRLKVKHGTTIEVNVTDLTPNSHIKVLCQCDICGTTRWVVYKQVRHICHKCSMNTPRIKELVSKKHKGKVMSKESREKISKSIRGKNHPFYGKFGKDHPAFKNIFNTERKYHKDRYSLSGYSHWKQSILERDNHKCQKCSSRNNLHVHHINNFKHFPEQRLDINNGITLCQSCHQLKNGKSIHTLYGQNTTKEHLIEFMQS